MKFEELSESTIRYFPSTIDISDGALDEETNGFLSRNLSHAWSIAESRASNEWEDLLVWVVYQVIHKQAMSIFRQGLSKSIALSQLDTYELEEKYFQALQEEGYEELLKLYER